MFHFAGAVEKPEDRHAWTRKINGKLLKLERDVFLAGHHKAFVLFVDPCNFCEDCAPNKDECQYPMNARPSPEGMAVDVFTTARHCGYEIKVLADYSEEMNRYGFLLIE
jgi:predicted metal-binding protein